MKKLTEAWFRQAQDDYLMAQKAIEIELYRQVCFHSQQCAEKALKAMMLEEGKRIKRVHDLLELSKDVESLSLSLAASTEELAFLNQVYRFRYPPDIGLLPHGEPIKEDAQKALEVAGRVFEQVRKTLGAKTTSLPREDDQLHAGDG